MTTSTDTLKIQTVSNVEEFQERALNSPTPVLVDLWAPWCGPCRMQAPILDQVAEELGDSARIVKVNVDEAGDVAQQLGVRGIPTLVVFKEGQEQRRFVGVQSADTLIAALQR